ncbi:hypothetical protein SRABI98_00031 [Microbacterium sp. Bi98]|uniref:hypothetical protein n=1 Tax=Microbacterium sp. Bi98 TaxID=2821116 RepID=UPI001DF49604|nr:hypothetical protein [Microbacterium sp. Bi98]CAH0123734.1 hypothetical protein SRABI98_00031 [Microbacterium sp. Bi98]
MPMLPAAELARRLTDALGPTLVATLAGSKDTQGPIEWSRSDGARPDREVIRRLDCAELVWRMVSDAEGADVARLWFVGANPFLRGEDTVISAIREGRFQEVKTAAQALVDDSFSG